MSNTFSLTASIVLAALSIAAASAPSQAATRLMSSYMEAFQFRCENHGGSFARNGVNVLCETPTVDVQCEYVTDRQASCAWPGIANQISVIRVIGTLPTGHVSVATDGPSAADAFVAPVEAVVLTVNEVEQPTVEVPGDTLDVADADDDTANEDTPDNELGVNPPNDPKPNPKPGFEGPEDFQIAPEPKEPKPNFEGPADFQLAP